MMRKSRSPVPIIGNTIRKSIFEVEVSPGPTDYVSDFGSVRSNNTGVSIRQRPKTRVDFSPGPMTYKVDLAKDKFVRTRSSVVVIPTTGRKDTLGIDHKLYQPGPSDYNTEKKRGGP